MKVRYSVFDLLEMASDIFAVSAMRLVRWYAFVTKIGGVVVH